MRALLLILFLPIAGIGVKGLTEIPGEIRFHTESYPVPADFSVKHSEAVEQMLPLIAVFTLMALSPMLALAARRQ